MNLHRLIHFCFPAILVLAAAQARGVENSAAPELRPNGEPKISIPDEGISVPMLSFGGRPGVSVRINGHGPFPFLVDTGASFTVIDASLVGELSIPAANRRSIIEQLEIGDVTVRDFSVVAGPLLRLPGPGDAPRGVLSALSFPGYLLTFDFPHKQITLRRGTLGQPNGETIVSYEGSEVPTVPVRVAGREFHVHLDTGAPFPLALPAKYKEEVPLDEPVHEAGKGRTPSGEFQIYKGSLKGEIAIGGSKLAGHEIVFSDAVPYPGATPQGQLGCAALGDFAVTVDPRNHRVEFARAAVRP